MLEQLYLIIIASLTMRMEQVVSNALLDALQPPGHKRLNQSRPRYPRCAFWFLSSSFLITLILMIQFPWDNFATTNFPVMNNLLLNITLKSSSKVVTWMPLIGLNMLLFDIIQRCRALHTFRAIYWNSILLLYYLLIKNIYYCLFISSSHISVQRLVLQYMHL